jgi:signal transduction histidine kinase
VLWGVLGFVIGLGLAAAGAWGLVRRHLRRVRAAERRARSAERLAELGATTSGLAHEIKNPLSTIALNAQLLAEGINDLGAPVDAKAALVRRAGVLTREVERLRGILTDFLSYAGEIRLSRETADVNAVVDELLDFFAPQAIKAGVQVRPDLWRSRLPASIDVPAIKQALLNLMLNAVQAMSPRTAATDGASTGATPPPGPPASGPAQKELIVRTRPDHCEDDDGLSRHSVCIEVIDTGPGIAAEALPSIFKPYFTTKAGGTGLGLPTTRRIVEAHGGRINVHSEPGRGSAFTVTLPGDGVTGAAGQGP